MGLNIRDIIPRKEISIEELNGKLLCVDAFNTLYQFLTTIRQVDGTPLMDSQKRITSHLSGIFYRNISLLDEGLKLVYVFDEDDVNKFDPLFKQMMKLYLAEKLFPLHKKSSLQQDIRNEIELKMPKARSIDGQDKPPVRIENSKVVRARRYRRTISNKYNDYYFY